MSNEIIETDVLIIGAGPAGLSAAIHLADLIRQYNEFADGNKLQSATLPLNIIVLEKGGAVGNHNLSGAVINPTAFHVLTGIEDKDIPFESPVLKENIQFLTRHKSLVLPFHPPYMSNKGNFVASIGKIVRWLAGIAEQKGVQVFAGFDGHELIFENDLAVGVRTGATGLDKQGRPKANYQPPTDIRAKIIILAEGARGSLSKQLISKFALSKDRNPQVYSLGIKELWQVPEGAIVPGSITHTLGYPLISSQFGGGFIYGLSNNQVCVGLAVGLDYKDPTFDPHHAFQLYKKHSVVSKILKNGKILRYGARTISEGGLLSIPQLYYDNVLLVGDTAGFLSMPSLKGIHPAVESGMLAAKTAFEAIKNKDTSLKQLSLYGEIFKKSALYKELYALRNFRQSFKRNLFLGVLGFGAQILTRGRGLSLSGKVKMEEDFKSLSPIDILKGKTFLERNKKELIFDGVITFNKETDVFYSGTKHDEDQPSHILVPSAQICQQCIKKFDAPCQRFCPGDVFEIITDPVSGKKELILHPTNCLHCKTCDVKDPFENAIWQTPYGGNGPKYENM